MTRKEEEQLSEMGQHREPKQWLTLLVCFETYSSQLLVIVARNCGCFTIASHSKLCSPSPFMLIFPPCNILGIYTTVCRVVYPIPLVYIDNICELAEILFSAQGSKVTGKIGNKFGIFVKGSVCCFLEASMFTQIGKK